MTPRLDSAPCAVNFEGPADSTHSFTASRGPCASDAGAGGTRSSRSNRAHIMKKTKIASRLCTQQAEISAGTAWSQSWIRDHYATCRRVFHCVLSGCASPARCHSTNSYLGAVGYEIIVYFGNIYITVDWKCSRRKFMDGGNRLRIVHFLSHHSANKCASSLKRRIKLKEIRSYFMKLIFF